MSDSSTGGARAAAFFDFDGTLVDSTIAHYYRYFMRRRLSAAVWPLWYAWFLLKCVTYLVLDKIDRERLNIVFYRNYRGLEAARIKAMAEDCFRDEIVPRLFREVRDCIESHRSAGRTIVLVTGSIDFIVGPVATDFGVDHVIAPTLVEASGRFTGELMGPPIGGAEKARQMRAFAEERGIDLAASYGYGDSTADLPMLEAVGFPQAVNADRGLAGVAASRGWAVHTWSREGLAVASQGG
jgi:fatty acyl-CoA reductase